MVQECLQEVSFVLSLIDHTLECAWRAKVFISWRFVMSNLNWALGLANPNLVGCLDKTFVIVILFVALGRTKKGD